MYYSSSIGFPYVKNQKPYFVSEDWTGPINYYRNFPFTRLNIDEQIDNKTLLIVGNMDPFVTIETIIQSSEFVETSSVKVIPGARHFPHQEKPDAVNNAIIKFLIGKFYFIHFFISLSLSSIKSFSFTYKLCYSSSADYERNNVSYISRIYMSK